MGGCMSNSGVFNFKWFLFSIAIFLVVQKLFLPASVLRFFSLSNMQTQEEIRHTIAGKELLMFMVYLNH
ncbi:MAG: hypothetical protein DRP59_08665 [Spirochaetes bacterium]|nr:MAG: hypothetical protein DRP59_08665 [Spirochaetota bacterium]